MDLPPRILLAMDLAMEANSEAAIRYPIILTFNNPIIQQISVMFTIIIAHTLPTPMWPIYQVHNSQVLTTRPTIKPYNRKLRHIRTTNQTTTPKRHNTPTNPPLTCLMNQILDMQVPLWLLVLPFAWDLAPSMKEIHGQCHRLIMIIPTESMVGSRSIRDRHIDKAHRTGLKWVVVDLPCGKGPAVGYTTNEETRTASVSFTNQPGRPKLLQRCLALAIPYP